MAYDLYKFLQKDVSVESLQESTDKAYGKKADEVVGFKRVVRKKANEGIVVADPSTITDPEATIQTLAEEKAKKDQEAATDPNIKTNGSGITDAPEKTRLQKDMEKNTSDPDKLTQGKDGLDPDAKAGAPKAKEEKKITPKVSSVEEVKESDNVGKVPVIAKPEQGDSKKPLEVSGLEPKKAENEKAASEGIVVADPSTITDPEATIQTLAEERVLTTVSDENVANDLKSKYPGSRVVNDTDPTGKKQYIVMVKEAAYKAIVEKAASVKEEVSVAVTTDDKTVDVVASPDGTTVTTTDNGATQAAPAPVETVPEVPEMDTKEAPAEEIAADENDDILVAEKLYVVELLKGKSSLSEKEQAFIKAVEGIQLDEAKKAKVATKLKAMKDKKK